MWGACIIYGFDHFDWLIDLHTYHDDKPVIYNSQLKQGHWKKTKRINIQTTVSESHWDHLFPWLPRQSEHRYYFGEGVGISLKS